MKFGEMTLSAYMDYLTQQEGPEQFLSEADGLVCVTPNGRIDMPLLVRDPCLADPQQSAWRNAYAWRLVEQYDDRAFVVEEDEPRSYVLIEDYEGHMEMCGYFWEQAVAYSLDDGDIRTREWLESLGTATFYDLQSDR